MKKRVSSKEKNEQIFSQKEDTFPV
jgi:hypothetical protein